MSVSLRPSESSSSLSDEYSKRVQNGEFSPEKGLDHFIEEMIIEDFEHRDAIGELKDFLKRTNNSASIGVYTKRLGQYYKIRKKIGVKSLKHLVVKGVEPLEFLVPRLLPAVGAALLVADPKAGKTTFVVNLALDVGIGEKAFDRIPLSGPRGVLYIGYENSEVSISRIADFVLNGKPCPQNVRIVTEWKKSDNGGKEDLAEYLTAYPDTGLVIIDTLANFLPVGSSQPSYKRDVAEMSQLNNFAKEHEIALLFLHHSNKKLHGDTNPIHTVSGTQGVAGSVDTVMRLTGHHENTRLWVAGRDIDQNDYPVHFDEETKRISLLSPEKSLTGNQFFVWDTLRIKDGGMSPKEIAESIGGMETNDVNQYLRRLLEKGYVEHLEFGKWRATTDTQ